METLFQSPQGSFKLQRLPESSSGSLRAWDAADEYLLNTLEQETRPGEGSRILIFNDSFGALAVALHHFKPIAVSDSYLSQTATRLNLAENGLPEDSVSLINSLQPLNGRFDYVLIKVPKTLAFLEDFLIRLHPFIDADTQVIAAGMVKSLPSSVWSLFQRLIGEPRTSLAKKKARLIFVKPDSELQIAAPPYPIYYQLEDTPYTLCNHANVFSRGSLDIGTRFLLKNLPVMPQAKEIIDLGCGNGVVGLILAERHPDATLHFVDESFMAVASAKENFRQAFHNRPDSEFHVSGGLEDFAEASADLIVCNPPFHQHHAVGEHVARGMFRQSQKVLKKGGQLWVIGNRHLGYHSHLKKRFQTTELVASNAKFVIIQATK